MRKPETEEKRNLVKTLYQQNVGYIEITKQTGITKPTIYRILKEENLIGTQEKESLVGNTYDKLLVTKYIRKARYEKGGTYHIYECECLCGETTYKRSGDLKRGASISCENCSNEKSHKDRVSGKIPSSIKLGIKNRTKKRGLLCDIDDEYLWSLYLKQNRKCAISGVDIAFAERAWDGKNNTASPDRIDSSKGYIKGNVQWVHKKVNSMKNTMSDDEFIDWCKKIAENN